MQRVPLLDCAGRRRSPAAMKAHAGGAIPAVIHETADRHHPDKRTEVDEDDG